jgi:hypothetical protein
MVDYSADLYDPVYALLGVPATMSIGTAGEVSLTVIDMTRLKSNATPAIGGGVVDVSSVGPAADARVYELSANGIYREDYRDAIFTFNGRSWIVFSHDMKGSPNGEDLGEVRFHLRSIESSNG